MKQTNTFQYQGTIITKSPLSTCPPETPDGRGGIKGLPRMNGRLYFPASGFRGKLRRVALDEVREALIAANGGDPAVFSAEDAFYLELGGIVEGKKAGDKEGAATILVNDYQALRELNPLASLFGAGKPFQKGRLQTGHLMPEAPTEPVEIRSVRSNPFQRDPGAIAYIRRDEVDSLILRLRRDGDNSRTKGELRDIARSLGTLEGDERTTAREEHNRRKAEIEGQVAIGLPNLGYEAIPPETVLTQSIALQGVTPIEHGLFLAMLRRFAGFPYLGAHLKDNNGEIEAHYRVVRIDGPSREEVGEVRIGFGVHQQTGELLDNALQAWTEALANIKDYDFRAPAAVIAKLKAMVIAKLKKAS